MGAKSPTVRARELGLALRRAVRAAGMDNVQLATRLGWSQSKVSNLFGGWRGASEIDVAMILALCDIRGPRRDHLLKLTRDSHEPGWWQDYEDRLPVELTTLIDIEDGATGIIDFETAVIPGLLQVPDYARALLENTITIPAREVDDRVASRMRRQELFNRHRPPHFLFFLDEYSLVRTGPGQAAMSEQLHHLLRMSVRPYVEIRVIPESTGFHAGTRPFHLMEISELHPVVHVEDLTSVLFLERKATTDTYLRVADMLDKVALSEELSREWIATVASMVGAPREEQDDAPDRGENGQLGVRDWPARDSELGTHGA